MENPPTLPTDVLQELLAEARKSGITSSASNNKLENGSAYDGKIVFNISTICKVGLQ